MVELLPEVSGTSVELHYWFSDKLHWMDAVVQNKCEAELLSIIKTIATELGLSINIETEPIGEGGIKRWFKIVNKRANRKKPVTTDVEIGRAHV